MSKNNKFNYRRPEKGRNRPNRPTGRERRITVRSVRKTTPDLRLLGRAAIAAALADASADEAIEPTGTTEASPTEPDTTSSAPATQQEIADDE
ncbi:hypothetical protein [Nocardia arthritidis]|uniref:hypothetical protein n=1 Tax=Nocardia arthritidis TaxID=228602 RepID=UPI000B01E036|nr:hypothetical protein [Nocardia arthritidis]